jgi:hypothetical protein
VQIDKFVRAPTESSPRKIKSNSPDENRKIISKGLIRTRRTIKQEVILTGVMIVVGGACTRWLVTTHLLVWFHNSLNRITVHRFTPRPLHSDSSKITCTPIRQGFKTPSIIFSPHQGKIPFTTCQFFSRMPWDLFLATSPFTEHVTTW